MTPTTPTKPEVPAEAPATIEDTLALLAKYHFLISNTFQVGEAGLFGDEAGWKVHLRNAYSTQRGSATAVTLREALFGAFVAAAGTGWYVSGAAMWPRGAQTSQAPARRGAPSPTVILAVDATESEVEDLF